MVLRIANQPLSSLDLPRVGRKRAHPWLDRWALVQPAGVSRQPLAVAGSVRSLDEAVGARIALANCLPGGVGLSGEVLVGN
jgi:hypothetical protein